MSTINTASTHTFGAFHSGQQAINTASNHINRAGADIVAHTARLDTPETGTVDESLVDLKTNETYAKAGAKVISTANDMIGSLLDTLA